MSSKIYKALMPTAYDDVDPVALKRAQDEIVEDELRQKRIKRGMGFGNMLEASRRGTFEGDEERDSVRSIPTGFRAMLESMSPTRTREIVEERPHIQRGLGFANMLECAFKGTE